MFTNGLLAVLILLALPVACGLFALAKLLMRFFSAERKENGSYSVFTREFDRVIHARDFDEFFGPLSQMAAETAEHDRVFYEERLTQRRLEAGPQTDERGLRLRERFSDQGRADFFITLLVDQSGSLRGEPILLAATACSVVHDFIVSLGSGCEVLGFTTSTWKGGKSREKWRRQGAFPKEVGRLCDLLHIIYKDGSEPGVCNDSIYMQMLRPNLLKENVDGEALQWAVGRLRNRHERRKILIVVSDGAPVDDSTLSNNDLTILERHLRHVIGRVEASGDIKLAALGLGHDVSRYYRDAIVLSDSDRVTSELAGIIERLMNEEGAKAARIQAS